MAKYQVNITIIYFQICSDGTSQTLRLHEAPIKSIDISYDNKLILSGADDNLLKVTSLVNPKAFFALNNHQHKIISARFSPDSRLICSSSYDNTVKLFDVNQKSIFHSFDSYTAPIYSVRFHPDGTCIATGGGDKDINVRTYTPI